MWHFLERTCLSANVEHSPFGGTTSLPTWSTSIHVIFPLHPSMVHLIAILIWCPLLQHCKAHLLHATWQVDQCIKLMEINQILMLMHLTHNLWMQCFTTFEVMENVIYYHLISNMTFESTHQIMFLYLWIKILVHTTKKMMQPLSCTIMFVNASRFSCHSLVGTLPLGGTPTITHPSRTSTTNMTTLVIESIPSILVGLIITSSKNFSRCS